MNIRNILLVFAVVAAGPPLLLTAESHWDRRIPGRANLNRESIIRDTKARFVGDLVTVIIAEDTAVTNRENRQLNHQADESGGVSFSSETSGGFGTQGSDASVDLGGNSDRSMTGTSTFRSQREFEDRMTVVVVEVLPNGNLVVRGRRDSVITGEHRSLCISGVIRPIDLGPDNSISSGYITDLQLQYEGDGPESATLRQGWLSRGLNWLNPF